MMPHRRDHDRRLLTFARTVRRTPSDAERKMWWILRRKRISGFRFRRQVPIAGYVADFCCLSAGLVVDGAHHLDAPQLTHDQRRTDVLEREGLRVIRFFANDVLKHSDAVERMIYRALMEPPPRPSPGVPGEGENEQPLAGALPEKLSPRLPPVR
jgi:very-short-patch-repair endonuclease